MSELENFDPTIESQKPQNEGQNSSERVENSPEYKAEKLILERQLEERGITVEKLQQIISDLDARKAAKERDGAATMTDSEKEDLFNRVIGPSSINKN